MENVQQFYTSCFCRKLISNVHNAMHNYQLPDGHSTEQKQLVVLNIYQMLEQKLIFKFEAYTGKCQIQDYPSKISAMCIAKLLKVPNGWFSQFQSHTYNKAVFALKTSIIQLLYSVQQIGCSVKVDSPFLPRMATWLMSGDHTTYLALDTVTLFNDLQEYINNNLKNIYTCI